ncbi:MAG: hypothetical protein ACKOWF_13165, partial [Chloroflexota bacterium]
GAGSVFSSTSAGGLHFGTSPFTAASSSTWAGGDLVYIPAGGPVGVGGVRVSMTTDSLNHRLEKRCVQSLANKIRAATVRISGPNGFAKSQRFAVCTLANAAAVVRTFDLLDPGDYTATVQIGKRSEQETFTVKPNRTTKANLKLTPSFWSKP